MVRSFAASKRHCRFAFSHSMFSQTSEVLQCKTSVYAVRLSVHITNIDTECKPHKTFLNYNYCSASVSAAGATPDISVPRIDESAV